MSKLRIVVIAGNMPIFTFERAIDKARPSGNFATGLVSVKGKRYRISLGTDKQISKDTPYTGLWEACMSLAYKSYYDACQKAGLSAFTYQAWGIHGYPMDGIGSKMDWSYGDKAS